MGVIHYRCHAIMSIKHNYIPPHRFPKRVYICEHTNRKTYTHLQTFHKTYRLASKPYDTYTYIGIHFYRNKFRVPFLIIIFETLMYIASRYFFNIYRCLFCLLYQFVSQTKLSIPQILISLKPLSGKHNYTHRR